MKKFTFVLILLTTLNLIWAQSYEYDKSFGDEGIVKVNCGDDICMGYKIKLLDEGYFLTFSLNSTFAASENEEDENKLEIMKFDPDGNLDTSFAEKGIFSINAYFAESPVDICVLPDKRIIVQDLESVDSLKIYILNENGKILKTLNFQPLENDIVVPVKCLYQNGSLYIGGRNYYNENSFIFKTDLNGTIDSTFADNGFIDFPFQITDMEFQDSNLIILSSIYINESDHYRVFRVQANGNPDSNFAGQGFYEFESIGYDADLQIDNMKRIIISSFQETIIIRFTANGARDLSFGKSGIVNFENDNLPGNYYFNKILDNNSLILFGSLTNEEDNPFGVPAIFKLDEKGKRENSFGSSGLEIHNINYSGVNLNGEIDANNNILTIGAYIDTPDEDENFSMFLTRLKPKTSAENNILVGNDFTISPNPVYSNHLNFIFPTKNKDKMLIEVIDILGKNVLKTEISELNNDNNEISIDFPNNIKNGQYLVVVNDGKEIITKKIIVNR